MRKLILFALTVGAATVAIAADPAPQGPSRGHWDPAAFQQMRAKMQARRADDIALLLGLRPDQRPALDAFLATMEPPHREWDKDRAAGGAPKPPAGDESFLTGLDKMSAHIDSKDAEAKQHIEAARKFYTSLSPDQQRRFDALERLRRDHGRGGGHHGMRGPRGGMGGHGPDGGPPPPPLG
jgi:hypothetical protein